MSDVEDLLTRTLRDPDRALRPPADPLPAIRARVRRQRRTTVLAAAAAAAVLVGAAAVSVPVALARPDPAPVAGDPTPVPGLPAGGLRWEPHGPLIADAALVRAAATAWQGVPVDGPVGAIRPVWAGRMGDARVVVLQAAGADGGPLLAQVGERDGAPTVQRVEPVWDPDAVMLRLVDPGSAGTALIVRPGGAAVVPLGEADGRTLPRDRDSDGDADALPVDRSGLRLDERDLARQGAAVLDDRDQLLGSGTVPLRGLLSTTPDSVRLVAPLALAGAAHWPDADDYYNVGARLASQLPGTGPVRMAVVQPSGMGFGSEVATPRFYELEQDGRRWTASELLVNGRSTCLRVEPGGPRDATVLRCPVPAADDGAIVIALHRGIRLAGIRLGAYESTFPVPVRDGMVIGTGKAFPTEAGEVELVDDAGTPRPPVTVPAYRP